MICPNCNAEVSGSMKFCENCGAALPAEDTQQVTEPVEAQVNEPAIDPEVAPTNEPAIEPEAVPASGPAAEPAYTPVAATQPVIDPIPPAQQFGQQPYGQPGQPGQQPPTGQYGQPGAYVPPTPSAPQPSAAPFVIAIIALVCAVFWLFPVSIILAIIALVMNSGQKKRGEVSNKQTPTTVMSVISIIFSVLEIIVVALFGGLIWYAIQTGEFDLDSLDKSTSSTAIVSTKSSSTSVSSASTSSASSSSATNSSSASTSGTRIASVSDLCGKWELTGLVEDGVEADASDIRRMQDLGLEVSLSINTDGSAVLTLFGVEMAGTWEASSPYAVTFVLEGEHIYCSVDTDTAELTMIEGSDELTFTKM